MNILLHSAMIVITDYHEKKYNGNNTLEIIHLDGTESSVIYRCFSGCQNLRIVTATAVVTEIFTGAFDGCNALEELHFPGVTTFERYSYDHFYKDIIVSELILKIKVFDFPKLTSTISGLSGDENSYYIGSFFTKCSELETVNLQSYEKRESFSGCSKLSSINLESAKSLGSFENCISLRSLSANQAESIQSFAGCTSLTSISLNSLKLVPDFAFANCSSLEEYDFNSIDRIGSRAFANCIQLSRLLNLNGARINEEAFANCTSITSVEFHQGTIIGKKAFHGCNKLNKVDLTTVKRIGEAAFLGTSISGKLTIGTDIDDDEQIGLIDNEAFKNLELSSVTIGKYIEVNQCAFYNTTLENLSLNTGCIIHSNAFRNVVPLRILYMTDCKVDTNAFFLCMNINTLHIDGRLLELQSGCFDSIKACVYYYGVDDYYLDTTIIVINRVYTAVFVKHNYNHKTFCVIPVTKGFNNPCPRERVSNAFIFTPPGNLTQNQNSEPTCQDCISNPKAAYLLSFFIEIKD